MPVPEAVNASTAMESVRVGLYVEGVRSLRDVHPLWTTASSLELDHICVDLLAWFSPVSSSVTGVKSAYFLSDTVFPLDELCTCLALRMLVPSGFNLDQPGYLDSELMDLRKDRTTALLDALRCQMDHASLFCMHQSRPVVVLPYASDMGFKYAERILGFVPRRLDAGHEIIRMDSRSCENFWIHLPLTDSSVDYAWADTNTESGDTTLAIWKWWLELKQSVNSGRQVGVALEIPEDLPDDLSVAELWKAEPVRALFIPTSIFVSGEDGSPVLPARHKDLILGFLELSDIQVSLRPGGILDKDSVLNLVPYARYLRSVRGTHRPACPSVVPVLFPPMDTVHHNLAMSHYSEFELDKRKYADYEDALHQYFKFRQSKASAPDVFVVAVVGCGRGPLVTAALNVARDCGLQVRLYALEKNPVTWPYLEGKIQDEWNSAKVILVKEDVRLWQHSEDFDIILSELLGSFGDNELCPEILQVTEKWLKPGGVFIPQQYTSFLCPVALPKVYELTASSTAEWTERFRQTVYGFDVDRFRLLGIPQNIFVFSHPSDGDRTIWTTEKSFEINNPGMLHGFSGYFEAVLYGSVEHSLVPGRRTEGLMSWKNILFPLMSPVMVEKGQTVRLKFSRHKTEHFVWYEWMLLEPVISALHNAGGAVCKMPLH